METIIEAEGCMLVTTDINTDDQTAYLAFSDSVDPTGDNYVHLSVDQISELISALAAIRRELLTQG